MWILLYNSSFIPKKRITCSTKMIGKLSDTARTTGKKQAIGILVADIHELESFIAFYFLLLNQNNFKPVRQFFDH